MLVDWLVICFVGWLVVVIIIIIIIIVAVVVIIIIIVVVVVVVVNIIWSLNSNLYYQMGLYVNYLGSTNEVVGTGRQYLLDELI